LKDLKNKIDSLLSISRREEVNGKLALMILWHKLLYHQ
jgi:hypothetical protein